MYRAVRIDLCENISFGLRPKQFHNVANYLVCVIASLEDGVCCDSPIVKFIYKTNISAKHLRKLGKSAAPTKGELLPYSSFLLC